jgi:hypothetical protein
MRGLALGANDKGADALARMTILPPSRAGSVTSTYCLPRASRSMMLREARLLSSSSEVNRKVIGNFVLRPACAIRRNAAIASMSPPFMS